MRDIYIIGGITLAAVVIGTTLFLFGPASLQSDVNAALNSAQTGGTSTVPFTPLESGNSALGVSVRTNYRISSRNDLDALWPLLYGEKDAPPIPQIDFSKYEILTLFDGSHSTTGHGIAVASITDANAVRTVVVTHIVPDGDCSVGTSSNSPFIVIRVPKTTFQLAHQDVTASSTCK